MGTIADKIQYTYDAIEDIKAALASKGINLAGVTLKEFGDIIRSIESSAGIGGSEITFPDYDPTTNDYYCSRTIDPSLSILTSTDFSFTDNVVQIEEEE